MIARQDDWTVGGKVLDTFDSDLEQHSQDWSEQSLEDPVGHLRIVEASAELMASRWPTSPSPDY